MSRRNKKNKQPPILLPEKAKSNSRLRIVLLICISALTFICYSYTLKNSFTNWDDDIYVENNPYIKDVNAPNLKMILFHNVTNNYYHPVTMLTLAANYSMSKMEPFGYYFTNVIMHVLNTVLMFFLVYMLLDAMEDKGYGMFKGKEWLAAAGALLFGLHPMHVESVSWLAERKDVIYGFFYFSGLIAYIKYVKEEKIKWMIYVLILFLLSLLSKPLAVTFPLSLLAMDVLLKRDFKRKVWVEKLPFLLFAIAAGIWVVVASKQENALAIHNYNFLQKLMFASYALLMYVTKAFVPFHLSAYYPYPNLNNGIPFIYYSALLILIAIVWLAVRLAKKASSNYARVLIFGFLFLLANVMFILQIVSSGAAVMADRYTYIAYFGIFMAVVYFIYQVWDKKPLLRIPLWIATGLYMGVLGFVCFNRTKVWHNTKTIWADVIKKYPGQVELAYNSLGSYYFNAGEMDSAAGYYKKAVSMHTGDSKVYCNLANIYALKGQYGEAFKAYSEGIKLDTNDFTAYLDRAVTYSSIGKFDSATMDYNRAYRIDSTSEKLVRARAFNYLNAGQYDKSIADYKKLIRLNPDVPFYYQKLGVAEAYQGDTATAFAYLKHSLEMEPASGSCLFDLSLTYQQVKDYAKALDYAIKAKHTGYKLPDAYISNLRQSLNSPVK